MDEGAARDKLLPRCSPPHGYTEVGPVEVPRILPPLSPAQEGVAVVAPLGMDHEEVLVICPVCVLNDPLEVLGSGRDGIHEGVEHGKLPVPVVKLPFAAARELRPVIGLYPYPAPDIVGPEPCKDEGDEEKTEGRVQGVGVRGEPAPRRHLHHVPLVGGQAPEHHVVINIGRERVLVEKVLGVKLELAEGMEVLVVVEMPL